jgi:hypothetical protein
MGKEAEELIQKLKAMGVDVLTKEAASHKVEQRLDEDRRRRQAEADVAERKAKEEWKSLAEDFETKYKAEVEGRKNDATELEQLRKIASEQVKATIASWEDEARKLVNEESGPAAQWAMIGRLRPLVEKVQKASSTGVGAWASQAGAGVGQQPGARRPSGGNPASPPPVGTTMTADEQRAAEEAQAGMYAQL